MNAKDFWEQTDQANRLKYVKGIPHSADTLAWKELSFREKRAVRKAVREGRMKPDIALLYAVRRKDDDWYYKKTKSRYLKKWPRDDSRLSHWTPDANEATFYPLKGIKAIFGQLRGSAHREHLRLLKKQKPHTKKDKPGTQEYEVVKFVCTEQPEVVPV